MSSPQQSAALQPSSALLPLATGTYDYLGTTSPKRTRASSFSEQNGLRPKAESDAQFKIPPAVPDKATKPPLKPRPTFVRSATTGGFSPRGALTSSAPASADQLNLPPVPPKPLLLRRTSSTAIRKDLEISKESEQPGPQQPLSATPGVERRLSLPAQTSAQLSARARNQDTLSPKRSNREAGDGDSARDITGSPNTRPKTPRQLAAGLWTSASSLVKDTFTKLNTSTSQPGSPRRGSVPTSVAESVSPRGSPAPALGTSSGGGSSSEAEQLELQQWPNKPKPTSAWKADVLQAARNLTMVVLHPDYNYEFGRPHAKLTGPLDFADEDKFVYYYRDYLYKKPHRNYISVDAGQENCIIYSVETTKNVARSKVMVRTRRGDDRFFVMDRGTLLEQLQAAYPEMVGAQVYEITAPEFLDVLVDFEQRTLTPKQTKFGVLYQKDGQVEEDDWYSNLGHSVEFDDFLGWLGERVALKNWSKFRGGLNVTTNSTGTHSIYTTFEDVEIMFHVSTFIPFSPNDVQQVERKRHLGNDVLLIVFRDANCRTPFDPSKVRSQFNHVFCVVQVDSSKPGPKPHYQFTFIYKFGVAQYGPYLPAEPSFEQSDELRRWLFFKLINAERAAMYAPDFRSKLAVGRKLMLQNLVEEWPRKEKTWTANPATLLKKITADEKK